LNLVKLEVLLLGGGVAGPAGVVRVRLELLVHVFQQHLVSGLENGFFCVVDASLK
jgi:hypothetical protein